MTNANTNPSGIPVTWSALIAQNREPLIAGLEQLRALPDEIAETGDDPLVTEPVGESLLGASGMLAQAAMVYGPETCEPYWEVILPLLPRAFEEVGPDVTRDNRVLAASVLSLVNVVRCCGVELPDTLRTSVGSAERNWPAESARFVPQMNERERWTVVLSALAAGDGTDPGARNTTDDTTREMEVVTSVAGGGPIPNRIDPAAVFELNVQGFVRHLAAAKATGASLTSILPALRNFVQRFPHKLAAGTLNWDHLLYAGRIVFAAIGKESVNTVAPAMYALISDLAFEDIV